MLHELVASIECTDDLLSILKLLPINEQIEELDLNSSKQMYYTQMPIDQIFSAVTQLYKPLNNTNINDILFINIVNNYIK